MKRCKKCGEEKPLEDFYVNEGGRDGRRPECKACTSARRKLWYKANREREIERVRAWQQANHEYYLKKQAEYRASTVRDDRAGHLKRKFGLTLEEYDALLEAQGGRCAICRGLPGKISLHVDHGHETGEVRGLLCFRCNGGAGQFKEDVELLYRATDYLESSGLVGAMQLEEQARDRARALEDLAA